MGVRYPSVASNTFVGPLPASAVETVICVTPPLTLPLDGAQVLLLWFYAATVGASITSLQARIRRGTTAAGTTVNAAVWPSTTVAGNLFTQAGWYFDTPGNVAGQQYALTLVQNGATGASSIQDVAFLAFAL